MEKKRVVPIWLSVVLLVLLVAGIAFDIFALLKYTELESWNTPVRIIDCIACGIALAYCLKGYSKNAAGFFKAFCIAYCVSRVFPIFAIAESYRAGNFVYPLILLMHLITFAAMSIFVVAKELGKKKSCVLAGIIFACTLVNLLPILGTPFYFMIGIITNLILTIVFLIMVYAKYQDKAARGTK